MTKSQELWKKAKKIIPGGSQLLSKRSEMFLPDNWPSYFQSAKGVTLTDLDGRTFIDMAYMGVGPCVLGYADEDVNLVVKKAIDSGISATLNCPEEVELAELLLQLHPWAQMVRYARSGGEAAAIAVRIARAHTKKDKVAFCGYHGWHDWYLSSNLADDSNLDGHLIPGLNPLGVPRGLIGTSLPFEYNKIEQLEEIVKVHDIGTIIMEPIRHQEPKNNFLEKVREIATAKGVVLIYDEISSGFRSTVGGVHLEFGVTPDIVVFAKAISNGFPMAAIVGKGEVMDAAQESFISSTNWTDRIGPVAAIATIKKMQKENVPAHLKRIGCLIGRGWESLGKKHNLDITVTGPDPLITFSLNYEKSLELKTLFTQEMLKRGYLATLTVYVSFSHTEDTVDKYLQSVDEVFALLKKAIDDDNIDDLLEGPVAHKGFRRLT
ncbi:MAG: Class III aminotransferase [Candidatus Daviesbacteria bacterium GW2011_GWA2_38_24]|uniref:Class III aminotransferase n=1 Tax=Candidatus Daviesbacteria bacterium GW2011_GWA2_38_24 TaxID=1618422 RepID=A0A0G0JHR6_9BACT|nr:MAG: Class III aminotransferase [Candidatus Daviesbacteria bacterium GW2011_GWA2_38_24]KKQ80634.1 MAG: Class III aminotransferase [Candidatus Daviesbacteria bacterium GW2011_GWA1_38_7]